jgi:hypothetical protein
MQSLVSPLEYQTGVTVTTRDVVMLVGAPTPYGMLEHLSAEWVLAMREAGRNAYLVRTGGARGLEALQSLLHAGRPQAFVSFSGVNWDLMANDRLLYDAIDVPYVGLMFDDPAYFPQRHRVASPNLTLLFTDDDHHDASLAISPANAPRGRFRFGVRPPTDAQVAHAQRTIPILFAKTPGDALAERRSWDGFAPAMRAVLNDVADVALWQEERGLWPIVRARLAVDGLTSGLQQTVGMATIVARVDHYVRLARAQRMVEALAPHDALILGAGWRAHLPANARARVVDSCSMSELLGLMSDARICVNVQPNTRVAPHERLLFAMQRGCCTLTDAAPPVRAAVGNDRICGVSWREPIADVVASLVADPARVERIGNAAWPAARREWSTARGVSSVLGALDTLSAILSTASPITLPAALSA